MDTYFKIYVQGEHFKARLFPKGLLELTSQEFCEMVMSYTHAEGTYYFNYGSFKVVLKVFPKHEKSE